MITRLKYLLKNEPQSGRLNNEALDGRGDGSDTGDSDTISAADEAAPGVVEYVRQYGIKPASRQFGLARPTVRQWWRNWQREAASAA